MNEKEMLTTEKIILEYNKNCVLPIDIFSIVKNMGYNIIFYENDISIFGEYNSKELTMKINKRKSLREQKFICAHMFAHMINDKNNGIETKDTFGNDKVNNEIVANKIASELLMPTLYINIMIEKKNITNPQELSKIFDVSYNAMIYRLQKLGYF